jgi:hypothetical protein
MTTGDPIAPLGAVRIGDAERTATAGRLAAHAAAGRLTFDELEQRLERVQAAVHDRDLAALEADLPASAPRRRPPLRRGRPPIALAVVLVAVLASIAAGHPIVPLFIAAALLWAAGHRTGRPPRHVTTPS